MRWRGEPWRFVPPRPPPGGAREPSRGPAPRASTPSVTTPATVPLRELEARGARPRSLLRIGTTLPNRHGSQTRPPRGPGLPAVGASRRALRSVPHLRSVPRLRSVRSVRSVPRLHISRLCSIHLTALSSGSSLNVHGRNCASRPRVINPAPSRTFRCLETDCRVISKGSASTFTVARPWARRARMARLVGSASAANVRSSWSSSTPLSVSVDKPIG